MTLGGMRMMPLSLMQWAGILLAGGSAVLTGYVAGLCIALMTTESPVALPMLLEWLLLLGITGLISGGIWVQFTWKTQQNRIQHG